MLGSFIIINAGCATRIFYITINQTTSCVKTMIKSFRHKGLRAYFLTGNASGINSKHKQKIKDQLEFLHSADCVDDMDIPGYDLHELKGSRTQEWSIKVSKNWRIVFRFEEGDAYIVNYEDYH